MHKFVPQIKRYTEVYHASYGGQEDERKVNYSDMVRDINI